MNESQKRGMVIAVSLLGIILIIVLLLFVTRNDSGDSNQHGIEQETEEVDQDALSIDGEDSSSQTGDSNDNEIVKNNDDIITAEKKPDLVSGEDVEELVQDNNEAVKEGDIKCSEFSIYSGQFVEDGKDELVNNVAAVLVTNHSDKYLEFATLQYDIDGKEAYFVATGLPAGKSAWVLEKSRLTIESGAKFTYKGCVDSFRDDVITSTEKIGVSASLNMLTAKNNTDKTLKDVCIYYKVKHTDGKYLGGITYVVNYGELKAGESLEKLAGHYAEENAEIVRISWNED